MNKDQLNNVSGVTLHRAAYAVLNANQNQPPHVQLAAPAATLVAMCDAMNIRPTDVLEVAGSLLRGNESRAHQYKALASYAKAKLS